MADELTVYLKTAKPRGFRSRPFYSPEGDCLTFYFADEDHHAERMDEFLTVYRSMDRDKFVGFKLKGVAHLLELVGNFCFQVFDGNGDLKLSMLLAAGTMNTKEPCAVPAYQEFATKTSQVRVNKRELQASV